MCVHCSCIQHWLKWFVSTPGWGWGQRLGLGMYLMVKGYNKPPGNEYKPMQRPQMCVCVCLFRPCFAATGGLRPKGGVSRDLPHVRIRERRVGNGEICGKRVCAVVLMCTCVCVLAGLSPGRFLHCRTSQRWWTSCWGELRLSLLGNDSETNTITDQ